VPRGRRRPTGHGEAGATSGCLHHVPSAIKGAPHTIGAEDQQPDPGREPPARGDALGPGEAIGPLVELENERRGRTSDWTFLRPTGFVANTLMWTDQIRRSDEVRWVYGQAARSLIDERDIAAVAVRTLTEPGHSRERYVLTGPEAITQAAQVHDRGRHGDGQTSVTRCRDAGTCRRLSVASVGGGLAEVVAPMWAELDADPRAKAARGLRDRV
jgi:hypothetical protein